MSGSDRDKNRVDPHARGVGDESGELSPEELARLSGGGFGAALPPTPSAPKGPRPFQTPEREKGQPDEFIKPF
jgi:hypothetical protein